jgi:hypothetical protein
MTTTLLTWSCYAQESKDVFTKEAVERWRLVSDDISTSFSVNRNNEPIPNLRKSTILNLWNPTVAENRLGQVFLWTADGKPILVGTIMTGNGLGKRDAVNIIYEFHSLDSQPIQVKKDRVLLDCPSPGVEWHRLETKDAPSQNRARRLIEMRNIAKSFQVVGSTAENPNRNLELLPSPIYRFEEPNSSATDGAIFAWVKATDPNVFILIEARDKDWWVAFARSTIITLNINRDNKLFFKFDPIPRDSERLSGRPFYIDWIGERRSSREPELKLPMSIR